MKKIIMNSKAKILVGVLVVGLIVIGSVLIIAEHTGNLTQHEAVSEDILPIYLRATPYELSSNELKVGKPFNLTIELKTANINARVLDGNYTGKLILIGENVSIVSKVLWEGKIKKNIDEMKYINEWVTDFAKEKGNPRALVYVGNELLTEHFRKDRAEDELITRATWERARLRAEEVLS